MIKCPCDAEEIRAEEIVIDAVAPFVVGLFTKRSQEQPDWTFATGTAIQFKGQKLILTAAHVLSEKQGGQPADLVFLPMPHGGFKISKSLEGGNFQMPKPRSRIAPNSLSRMVTGLGVPQCRTFLFSHQFNLHNRPSRCGLVHRPVASAGGPHKYLIPAHFVSA